MSMRKFLHCFNIFLLISVVFYTIPVYAVTESTTKVFYVNKIKGKDTNDGLTPRRAFKTVQRAKKAAEEAVCYSDVEVKLSNGIYYVDDGLNFTNVQNYGGNFQITFCPQIEGGEVIISGGKEIAGFEIFDVEKNIYRAPWTKACRQLYINGTPAVRARSKDHMGFEFNNDLTAFESKNKEILSWQNAKQAELVFKKEFVSRRVMIDSVEEKNDTAVIKMNKSTTYTLTNTAGVLLKAGESPWYIENAYELLDEGGEWYHDGEYIYYKPLEDQKIESAVISDVEKPINIAGTSQSHVKGLLFKNITFSHGSWMLPTNKREFIDSQNNYDGNCIETVPAVVNIEFGEHIEFDGCTFKNSGANGLNIMNGSKNIIVQNSEFCNLSAVGIQIGTLASIDNDNIIEEIIVRNNRIHDCGIEYRSASGLAYVCAKNCSFLNNEIYNLPYSGIHTGWGWNYWKNTVTEGIQIKYNYIHDCMRELEDGGLIYTLGGSNTEAGQRGKYNEIAYNYLENMHHIGGLIYNDEGSSYWSVHHNVISQDSQYGSISWYNAAPNTNHLINQFNYSNTANLDKFRSEDSILREMIKNNTYFEGEISDYTAKIIRENAGCVENHIKTLDELFETALKKDVFSIGQEVLLYERGFLEFSETLKDETLNLCVLTDGDLEISIDENQSITVGKDGVTFSENGVYKNSNKIENVDITAVKNLSLSLGENRLILVINNIAVINYNTKISEGIVKITQKNGRAVLGSLIREYSYYKNRISSDFYKDNRGDNIVSNGYFERTIRSWNSVDATISREKRTTYNGSLGSMKIQQNLNQNESLPGYAYTNVDFRANKWYRISSFIYVEGVINSSGDEVYQEDAQAKFYIKSESGFASDGWKQDSEYYWEKAEHGLKSGWNYVSMYVFADSDISAPVFPVIENKNGKSKMYVYYLDDFTVREEAPQISDCGFSQGIGQSISPWKGWGLDVGYSENFGYQSNDSIFFDTSNTATYHKPIKCVYLKPGKTYRMRAKLYVESTVESPNNKQIYLGVIDDYTTNTPDRHKGCAGGEIRLNEWVTRDVTFTWDAKTTKDLGGLYEAYVCVFFESGIKGKCYIDDFELFEVSAEMPRTQNKDFLNGQTAWNLTGDLRKICFDTQNGAEIFSGNDIAMLSQNLYVLKNVKYYVSAVVCLNDSYDKEKLAYIELKPSNSDVQDVIADGCMSLNAPNKVYDTQKRLIDGNKFVQLGGYITFRSESYFEEGFSAELCLNISNANDQSIHYFVKEFQMIPAEDYQTNITEVHLSANGNVTYQAEGNGKIRYSYLIDDGAEVRVNKTGYVDIGDELPVLGYRDGETAVAELTSFAINGDECKNYSNSVKNTNMPDVAVSKITEKDDGVQLRVIYRNYTAKTIPAVVYMVQKSKTDGKIMSIQCRSWEISEYDGEEKIIFSVPKEDKQILFYCWDEKQTPLCGVTKLN